MQPTNENLLKIAKTNPNTKFILEELEFPEGLEWFLAGGGINQTLWNYLTGRDWDYGIVDYDIPYWDDDLSSQKEEEINRRVKAQLAHLKIETDIVNQARVHLWFKDFFGKEISPFSSLKQVPTLHCLTVMCLGINQHEIYSPFGLKDNFSMQLRYNAKTHMPEKHVLSKIKKWKAKWPELEVVKDGFPFEVNL